MIGKVTVFVAGKANHVALIHCLLIVIVGLAAYSNTFQTGFNFDDLDNINLNKAISSFSSDGFRFFLHSQRGIGFFSFFLNYRLGGLDVTGYHLVNVAIHLLNALIIYWIILITARFYCNSYKSKHSAWNHFQPALVAFFPATLFVAHPVQTQAVTYVVQRFTSLCSLFYLGGILFYAVARYSRNAEPKDDNILPLRHWGFMGASLVCAILASKTKEIAFTFPVSLLIYEFIFFRSTLRQRIRHLIVPVIVPLVLSGMMFFQILSSGGLKGLSEFTKVQTNISRIDYLLTQFRVLITYIRLLIFPVNQSIDYDYPIFTSFNWQVALSAMTLGIILGTGLWLWIRSRKESFTPEMFYLRLIAFGIFWFFITISIESSILPIVDVIFEHRLYLPSFGALSSIAASIMLGASKIKFLSTNRTNLICLFLPIIFILAFGTYQRNKVWANDLTLWQDAYSKAPNKARVANNYAAALILRGKGETALPLLISSIEREPGYFASWNNLPRVYAQIPFLKGFYKTGFEFLLQDGEVNPVYVAKWFSNALNNLGLAYLLQNDSVNAYKNFKKALEMNPQSELARKNALNFISAMPNRVQAAIYLEQLQKISSMQ